MSDPNSVATALANGIELINKLYDQVLNYIENRRQAKLLKEHSVTIEGKGAEISLRNGDKIVKTITAKDFASLSESDRKHIMVLEKSLQNNYDLWAEVYPYRNSSGDRMVDAKTNQQLKQIVLDMKDDLNGILGYLQSMGIYLDDHYVMFRDVVNRFG